MAERTGRERGARRYFKNTRRACADTDEARACTQTDTTEIQDAPKTTAAHQQKAADQRAEKQPARKDHKKSPVITITNLARAAYFRSRSQSSHGGRPHCHSACRGEQGRSRNQVGHPSSGNHGTAHRASPRGVGPRAAPPPRLRRDLVAAHPAASPDPADPWCMLLSRGVLCVSETQHPAEQRRPCKPMMSLLETV